jgi:hypothetical protein
MIIKGTMETGLNHFLCIDKEKRRKLRVYGGDENYDVNRGSANSSEGAI